MPSEPQPHPPGTLPEKKGLESNSQLGVKASSRGACGFQLSPAYGSQGQRTHRSRGRGCWLPAPSAALPRGAPSQAGAGLGTGETLRWNEITTEENIVCRKTAKAPEGRDADEPTETRWGHSQYTISSVWRPGPWKDRGFWGCGRQCSVKCKGL